MVERGSRDGESKWERSSSIYEQEGLNREGALDAEEVVKLCFDDGMYPSKPIGFVMLLDKEILSDLTLRGSQSIHLCQGLFSESWGRYLAIETTRKGT